MDGSGIGLGRSTGVGHGCGAEVIGNGLASTVAAGADLGGRCGQHWAMVVQRCRQLPNRSQMHNRSGQTVRPDPVPKKSGGAFGYVSCAWFARWFDGQPRPLDESCERLGRFIGRAQQIRGQRQPASDQGFDHYVGPVNAGHLRGDGKTDAVARADQGHHHAQRGRMVSHRRLCIDSFQHRFNLLVTARARFWVTQH